MIESLSVGTVCSFSDISEDGAHVQVFLIGCGLVVVVILSGRSHELICVTKL